MDSSTNRRQEEERKQAEIRKQIALLQAQLKDTPDDSPVQPPTTPRKRKHGEQKLLAPATPSPKKRRAEEEDGAKKSKGLPARPTASTSKTRTAHPSLEKPPANHARPQPGPSKPAASNVLSKLASLTSTPAAEASTRTVARSAGFSERPPEPEEEQEQGEGARKRDENLAVIEDLELGPYDHKPPFDDPHFKKLEPNSGIRLSSREIPHEEFQDYLRGRYFLPPSKLYSVVRLLPNKQGYDVPVEGDWVTIAVVAERGPLRYSKAPVGVGKEDLAELPEGNDSIAALGLDAPPAPAKPDYARFKGKKKAEPAKPGKKYVNLKLVDFGCRARGSASAGTAVIRGDAMLSLLLFECDRVDEVEREDGRKEKVYRGGSRGAFERMAKLREGAVVALLNPRILKPFQRSGDAPHPTDNVLALTPESLASVLVLGHAQDLGMCAVLRHDGTPCGGWCDKRVGDVCEYHVQHAVQRKRAARPEFSSGTGGMTTHVRKKAAYDPARQWGLKPATEGLAGGGATYVVAGHVVSDRRESSSLFVGENLGRDAQAKAARQVSSKDADRALQVLLKRDRDGAKVLKAARDFGKKEERKAREEEGKGKKQGADGKKEKEKEKEAAKKRKRDENESDFSDDDDDDGEEPKKVAKNAFSASLVKNLGFDPTAKDGRKIQDTEVQRKLNTLATLQASRKEINLGPRPGKLKSTVWAPSSADTSRRDSADNADSWSSDDELIVEPPVVDTTS